MSGELSQEACEAQALLFQNDPFRFQRFNKAQTRFLRALKDPKPESLTIVLFLKPNRVGGSRILMASMSAIIFGTERPAAQCSPFGDKWPFPVRCARLISTAETLGDVGPLQKAMKDLFPVGRYVQSRGVGKAYNSAGKADNGWTWDAMSYGQTALAAAGSTMGVIFMSEPPPHDVYVECLTRLGGNGMMIVECTQLDMAPWLEELADDAGGLEVDGIQYGALKLDGKSVGEVRVVRGDIEDSCSEHSNGHQSHSAIEALVAGWPEEERASRRSGVPMKLSGRIFPGWSDLNELAAIPDWHQEQWDLGNVVVSNLLDPHDRKPWAIGWFATYPNDDVICFQEWPDFDFAKTKSSPITEIEDYRAIILGLDKAIGRVPDNWVIDKLFGNTPGKGTALTLRRMLARPCRDCLKHVGLAAFEDLDERSEAYLSAERDCQHIIRYSNGVAYSGSVNDGHILVRDWLGNPGKGHRSKLYALKATTPNFCKGMRKYSWAENSVDEKGHSEKPELIHKDFPDLVTNLFRRKLNIYPKDARPLPLHIARPRMILPPRLDPIVVTPTQTGRDGRPRVR